MLSKLIRIYTPFICALVAIIHGVFYLSEYSSRLCYIMNEFTGHSILILLYILATSSRMCVWYKITVYLLLTIHFLNLFYLFGMVEYYKIVYAGLVINILAFISFLVYRVTVGITKVLH